MECDTNKNSFDRCLFHQSSDDDGDFDQDGVFAKKGAVRIHSVPQYQWGPRCLSIRLQSYSVFTLSVHGSYIKTENSTDLDSFESDVTYSQETVSSNGEEVLNLLVMVFIIKLDDNVPLSKNRNLLKPFMVSNRQGSAVPEHPRSIPDH